MLFKKLMPSLLLGASLFTYNAYGSHVEEEIVENQKQGSLSNVHWSQQDIKNAVEEEKSHNNPYIENELIESVNDLQLSDIKRPILNLEDNLEIPFAVVQYGILHYLYANDMMGLSKSFYTAVTGYRLIGVKGIVHTPDLLIPDYEWRLNKWKKWDHKTMDSMPSWAWYQAMKIFPRVSKFEESTDSMEFLSYLPSLGKTKVRKLNLSGYEVKNGLVEEVFERLQGRTNLGTVLMSQSNLNNQVAITTIKKLEGTNVHTVNMSLNNIGDEGLTEIIESLKKTNVRKLYIGANDYTKEALPKIVKILAQGTNLHILGMDRGYIPNRIWGNFVDDLKKMSIPVDEN